jgi:hypothetical protein
VLEPFPEPRVFPERQLWELRLEAAFPQSRAGLVRGAHLGFRAAAWAGHRAFHPLADELAAEQERPQRR